MRRTLDLLLMPFILVAIGFFAVFWLIKDLFTGGCCEACRYWEKEKDRYDSI